MSTCPWCPEGYFPVSEQRDATRHDPDFNGFSITLGSSSCWFDGFTMDSPDPQHLTELTTRRFIEIHHAVSSSSQSAVRRDGSAILPVLPDKRSSKKARRMVGKRSTVSLLTQAAPSPRSRSRSRQHDQEDRDESTPALGNASLVPPFDGIFLYHVLIQDGAPPSGYESEFEALAKLVYSNRTKRQEPHACLQCRRNGLAPREAEITEAHSHLRTFSE